MTQQIEKLIDAAYDKGYERGKQMGRMEVMHEELKQTLFELQKNEFERNTKTEERELGAKD